MNTRHDGRFAIDAAWRVLLADLHIRAEDGLRLAQLPASLLHETPVRLPVDDFYRLWAALEQLTGDTPLPVAAARTLRGDAFSPVLFAALCSRDFAQAVTRVAQYKALTAPLRVTSHSTPTRFTVRLHPDGIPPLPPTFGVAELLFLLAMARLATRTEVPVIALTAPVLPPHHEAYAAYLGTRLTYGADYALTIPALEATRPFLTNDDALWVAFEPDLRRRLSQLGDAPSMADRVRAVLLEALPGGMADAAHVARTLAVSQRTLQRTLEHEGTSFSLVLRDVRESLARHYLERTALSLQEIAFLLGFGQPASFFRAFRDWTGLTPTAVRAAGRRLAAGQ
jgi:AraC-like DNA-binding protein